EFTAIIRNLAERFLFLPYYIEGRFTEPVDKMHIEIRKVLAEFLHFIIHTELTEFRHTLFVRLTRIFRSFLGKPLADHLDVFAVVSVLRHVEPSSAPLQVTCFAG